MALMTKKDYNTNYNEPGFNDPTEVNADDEKIYNEQQKKVHYKATRRYYCIFRIGKKFKNINQLRGFIAHMERFMEVPNSNGKENITLIGDTNLTERVAHELKDIKVRSNGVIARELLFTCSPGFFENQSKKEFDLWVQQQVKFCTENFHTCYMTVHL